ncbi:transketolase family protein [candidate division KSB1 bacterium]|nr:transketolase family protein [candidate division KSB1 bacterium]
MDSIILNEIGPAVSMRKVYGEALIQIGKDFPDVVVLSADVKNSDHSYMFEDHFPDRFINVGIAEQALVDVAVGFSKCGKIPVANTFAFLFATRALEMVRTHLCYGQANVKLAGAYAGLSDSFDGPTHHSITDLAIMAALPNMTVVVFSDPLNLQVLLPQIIKLDGPVYFRLCRNEVEPIFSSHYKPELGKGVQLMEGSDVSIIGCGILLSRCIKAAKELLKQGIHARVIEMHTIKPLDADIVRKCALETGAIVTVEEHSVIGGLGSSVAHLLAKTTPVPMEMIGLNDRFAETGPYHEILDKYGMAVDDIVSSVTKVLNRKKASHF